MKNPNIFFTRRIPDVSWCVRHTTIEIKSDLIPNFHYTGQILSQYGERVNEILHYQSHFIFEIDGEERCIPLAARFKILAGRYPCAIRTLGGGKSIYIKVENGDKSPMLLTAAPQHLSC